MGNEYMNKKTRENCFPKTQIINHGTGSVFMWFWMRDCVGTEGPVWLKPRGKIPSEFIFCLHLHWFSFHFLARKTVENVKVNPGSVGPITLHPPSFDLLRKYWVKMEIEWGTHQVISASAEPSTSSAARTRSRCRAVSASPACCFLSLLVLSFLLAKNGLKLILIDNASDWIAQLLL